MEQEGNRPQIHNVLLDYDDNLGITENVALGSACDLANSYFSENGLLPSPLSRDEFIERFPGTTFRDILEKLADEHTFSLAPNVVDSLVVEEKQAAIRALAEKLEPTPGAMEALETLSDMGMRLAIVSSSPKDRLKACLLCTNQNAYFDESTVFSAQDPSFTGRRKPFPDIYLHAIKTLGLKPEESIGVEDSVGGLTSLVEAGIPAVGNVGALAESKREKRSRELLEARAVCVIDDLSALPAVIKKIEEGSLEKKYYKWNGSELV